jgi:DNA-binding NtrC family response regulator
MTPLELKNARISLGFSQEKLAVVLGVARGSVIRWEAGSQKILNMLELALRQLEHEQRPPEPLREMERRAILQALSENDGNKAGAARLLGIGKTTLYRKLKEFTKAEIMTAMKA